MNNDKQNYPIISYNIKLRKLKTLCKTKKCLYIAFQKNQNNKNNQNNIFLTENGELVKTDLTSLEALNIFFLT